MCVFAGEEEDHSGADECLKVKSNAKRIRVFFDWFLEILVPVIDERTAPSPPPCVPVFLMNRLPLPLSLSLPLSHLSYLHPSPLHLVPLQ